MSVSVSIIMVDGGFRENLWTVHSWLDQTLDSSQFELIWVDYTDRKPPELQKYPNVKTICLNRNDEPQQISRCFNEGIKQAKGEIIVLPDADVVCEKSLLELILADVSDDPELVLYVLRLDQPEKLKVSAKDLESLKATCSIKHTFNYGGCTVVHKSSLIKMNGYEQLPFFAGYHYNGGDNYIRFKNMGLKVKWHPTARVYHPWHTLPVIEKFSTVNEQEDFIRWRAATWDWQAFDGLNADINRPYVMVENFTEWEQVITERGAFGKRNEQKPRGWLKRIKSLLVRIIK